MIISAHNISYRIGQRPILNKLNFDIQPGEVTVVLGQNGAGKSTFLKILSGEAKPTIGQVLLNNIDLHSIPVNKLATMRAVLSQQYAQGLQFNCEEIVMMGRYPYFGGQPGADDHRIVRESMLEMQVDHLQRRNYQALSGGEQQRVQMARVLSQLRGKQSGSKWKNEQQQGLLLLDEPTSSMDCLHQQLALSKAKELANQGYTVVVILHDLNLAAQFADTILLLKQGCIVRAGNVRDVLTSEHLSEAYNMEVDILEPEDYDFPILIPARHKNKPVLLRS
ncbi:heme ABC transporter ATP-binding protein [Pseudoflavitalea sp. G-6-1-2]|uniref:heme ABC transporter ATP-binding protein n=1 Tax=Pseudoflavitalea sp. G-6-1-2 TaxID=2728841 RepID=UPI00146F17C6|nr:heme ABC transporter ATP-binding protein [Pseudoflavitalea sp. G-6-1-2]NML20409.1 heme ABC transporter ATP-binding protein [Pseudoflavitalea sp. G-6-1-2]